ncbi:MAG: signal peptide peptidase SppA, partial [Paramuribaculum sp.]|nr:signal peptide peptidase SppA [Paramuribaculum sp.]
MKKFLYSFLGTMAGIWLSVLIGGALLVFTFVALIGSAMGGSSVKVEDQSVLRITLSGEIVDRASDMSLNEVLQSQGEMPLSLTDIVDAVTAAKTDDRIEGILLECSGIGAGMAQCDEILAALRDFKSSKKWIVAYSDNYSQADYFI